MKKPEWAEYGITGVTDKRAFALRKVYHICHLEDALRVFEDNRVRSSLVWDESKLRNSRTCVSWVSGNDWVWGSLYGNVRFTFEWETLVRGKNLFWVEAMPQYRPPAFRILVSKKEEIPGLTPYTATLPAPLLHDADSGAWKWNGNLTSEFLVDDDLMLRDCMQVDFVKHHHSFCRKSGSGCKQLGESERSMGSRFLSLLLADLSSSSALQLLTDGKERLDSDASMAWEAIRKSLKTSGGGRLRAEDDVAVDVVRAILRSYGREETDSMKRLSSLFKDTDHLREAADSLAVNAFKLPSADRLQLEEPS